MTVWKKAVSSDGKIASFFPKKTTERKEGDQVIGTYIGKRDMKRPDGTDDFVYLVKQEDGSLVGVNSSAGIVNQMEQVPTSKKVRVTFEGKKQNPKTSRFYNSFLVEVAADDEDNKTKEVQGEPVDPEEIPFE